MTIAWAIDDLQKTEDVLQDIVSDFTIDWFTGDESEGRGKLGKRMVDIGRLLYPNPNDFLHICLWESLTGMHPDIGKDAEKLKALLRPDAWRIADGVVESTTWDEFESAITGEVPLGGFPPKAQKVVPIH